MLQNEHRLLLTSIHMKISILCLLVNPKVHVEDLSIKLYVDHEININKFIINRIIILNLQNLVGQTVTKRYTLFVLVLFIELFLSSI